MPLTEQLRFNIIRFFHFEFTFAILLLFVFIFVEVMLGISFSMHWEQTGYMCFVPHAIA